MTQALSTRLKLSLDPLVYAYDTPGVMLPYLGRGFEGAERGVKLALIGMWNERISWTGVTHSSSLSAAGIKEGLYDIEALAAYLLYRLNTINSICEFRLLVGFALSGLTRSIVLGPYRLRLN